MIGVHSYTDGREGKQEPSLGKNLDFPKVLHLPSLPQFQEMATRIKTSGAGQAKDCANRFRFLAFSDVRVDEAMHVIPDTRRQR
jgi:hypothetical protein